jgi:hypothetical protein
VTEQWAPFPQSLRHPAHRGILAILLLISAGLLATVPAQAWSAAAGAATVDLHFFWSARCPHCLEARPFVLALPDSRPWLRLHDLEVSRSRENASRYIAMAQAIGQRAAAVPAFLFCGEMHVGWDSAERTGALLTERLDQCRERVLAGSAAAAAGAPASVELPWLGRVDVDGLSLPLFTAVIAGLDAFNPCAFFVLLFLLGLLINQRRRGRMLAIGGTFVLISGLMYFAFMAAWLNLFRLLDGLTWVTAAAALLAIVIGAINVKDFFAFKQGVSLTIPKTRLPRIYQQGRAVLSAGSFPAMLGATVVLGTAANFYELLCTAGFPMVYTRVLTLHGLPAGAHYLYLALYNLIYVIPLLVIVLVVTFAAGRRQLSEREGRLLKLLSGLMMLGLGLVLLLAPERLNSLWTAFALLGVAVALTALAAAAERRATPAR